MTTQHVNINEVMRYLQPIVVTFSRLSVVVDVDETHVPHALVPHHPREYESKKGTNLGYRSDSLGIQGRGNVYYLSNSPRKKTTSTNYIIIIYNNNIFAVSS